MAIDFTPTPINSAFSITSRTLDPGKFLPGLVIQERKAGNSYAALLEFFLHHGGFGSGYTREATSELLKQLDPARLLQNPICSVLYGIITSGDPLSDMHINLNLPMVLELARKGDNFARVIGALAVLKKDKVSEAEKLLRAVTGKSPKSVPEALNNQSLAIAQFELGNILRFKVSKTRRASEKDSLLDEASLLILAAANQGHRIAQYVIGDYLTIPSSPRILQSYFGEDKEKRFSIGIDWLLKAEAQRIQTATYFIGRTYQSLGSHKEAIAALRKYLSYPRKGLGPEDIRIAQWCLGDELKKDGQYAAAFSFCKGAFEEGNPIVAVQMFDFSRELPGVPRDDQLALRACIRALHPQKGLIPVEMTGNELAEWNAEFDQLKARAWKINQEGALVRAVLSTNYKDPVPTLAPLDAKERFLWFFNAAEPPTAVISADHALELAKHYATGMGCDLDNREARYWYQRAAELGSLEGAKEALPRFLEERGGASTDLLGALKVIRAALSHVKVGSKDEAEFLAHEQSILEPEATYPRLWLAKGPDKILQPVTRGDPLDEVVLAPLNPEQALAFFSRAGRHGSRQAARIAEQLYEEQNDHRRAFAMYQSAAGQGYLWAGLEVAKRHFEGRGTEHAPHLAHYIVRQMFAQELPPSLIEPTQELHGRLLKEAWILAEGAVLERWQREGKTEHKADENLPLIFFPHTEEGLDQLAQHQSTSFEAAVEVARRYEEGVGCKISLSEAFLYLSCVIFGGNKIESQPLPNVPIDDPLYEDVCSRWVNLAALTIPVEGEGVRYEFAGEENATTLEFLDRDSVEAFHAEVLKVKQALEPS